MEESEGSPNSSSLRLLFPRLDLVSAFSYYGMFWSWSWSRFSRQADACRSFQVVHVKDDRVQV